MGLESGSGGLHVASVKRCGLGAAFLLSALLAAGCGPLPHAASPQSSGSSQAVTTGVSRTGIDLLTGRTRLQGTPAPTFTLTNQFGQAVSLSAYRGRTVLLDFVDSQCTTVCPLATMAMIDAVKKLGAAGRRVAIIAVNANPTAYSVHDVYQYSVEHGVLHRWQFLTGSLSQLEAVWAGYHVKVAIVHGAIDHTPALYLIDAQGHERYLYLTSGQYGVVGTEAEVLAHDLAQVMGVRKVPPFPSSVPAAVTAHGTYRLPPLFFRHPGVTLALNKPHVIVFFGSWLPGLQRHLASLNAYAAWASSHGGPALVAVDELQTEPSLGVAQARVAAAHVRFPVVEDQSGQVADAFGARDMPWMVVVAHGSVLATHDGFVTGAALIREVRQALRQAG